MKITIPKKKNSSRPRINDLFLLEPEIYKDDRGYFYESYNEQELTTILLGHQIENKGGGLFKKFESIQENTSFSKFGVFRGMHYQSGKDAQTKIVTALSGIIMDIVVDIRPESTTYKQVEIFYLDDKNKKLLLIPKGCAHGFLVLSESAIVSYKIDVPYNPKSEVSINIKDELFENINWPIPINELIMSKKDDYSTYYDPTIPVL